MYSCVLLNPHGIPVVCQRSCKVSISDRTERAGRQLPVTGRTINKPDLSVQMPLRLCSKGSGTDPNSYTDQTTGLRSPAGKMIFFPSVAALREVHGREMWQRSLHQGSKDYRSYVSSTEMKNAWSFASTSSHFYKICI